MNDHHHDHLEEDEHDHEHEHGPLAELVTVRDWLRYAVTRFNRAGCFYGHGLQDAQKTMGVITLALITVGWQNAEHADPQLWVIIACAVTIAVGTYSGGWRIIRTMGKGLVEVCPPQGLAAEASSASVILASSHLGFALSTTHVATGSILGTGLGRRGADVRWGVAMRMVLAWFITLPAAGLVGAVCFWLGNGIGGYAGVLIVFGALVALTF